MEEEEQKKIDVSRLMSFAYHYLSYRARTKKEMEMYLKKKAEKYGFTADIVETAFTSLIDQGYVNDELFIESFIYSRGQNKPKGEYALMAELMQKGISRDLIENYFENNPIDERVLAYSALKKIWYRISRLPKLVRTKKAADFLGRRGFQYDTIKKTIEELEQEE